MDSNRQVVERVLLRAQLYRWKRTFIQRVTAIAAVSVCCLVGVISGILREVEGLQPLEPDSPYGSLLFFGEGIGGYILVGVIALTTGVVVTMLCLKLAKKLRDKEDGENL
ncbi:MAG: hypothetical protein R3Y62_02245 [Eubacteriales bacterium]